MSEQDQLVAVARKQGRLLGATFVVPIFAAMLILAGWCLVVVLLTPGVQAETSYGEMQRGMRFFLVIVGVLIELGGLREFYRSIAG